MGKRKNQLNVRLDPEDLAELEKHVEELGTTKSSLLRTITHSFLRYAKEHGLSLPPDWRAMLDSPDGRNEQAKEIHVEGDGQVMTITGENLKVKKSVIANDSDIGDISIE